MVLRRHLGDGRLRRRLPDSTGGRIVGVYVIVGGIVTLTLLFTQLATALQSVRGKRLRGVVALDLSDHVVLLGYWPGRTERIVAELTADGRFQVALCAWDDVAENPLPDQPAVHFVRGDLTHEDVMTRACVQRARTAVIDGRDDNETLAMAVAVDHANPDIHLVAALRDLSRRESLRYVNAGVQAVQWHMPFLLSEEANDPGITQIYNDLMSSGGHGNTYSLRVPAGLRRTPPSATARPGSGARSGRRCSPCGTATGCGSARRGTGRCREGTTLYYVAAERIDAQRMSVGR